MFGELKRLETGGSNKNIWEDAETLGERVHCSSAQSALGELDGQGNPMKCMLLGVDLGVALQAQGCLRGTAQRLPPAKAHLPVLLHPP